jgi:hypothetical protein
VWLFFVARPRRELRRPDAVVAGFTYLTHFTHSAFQKPCGLRGFNIRCGTAFLAAG